VEIGATGCAQAKRVRLEIFPARTRISLDVRVARGVSHEIFPARIRIFGSAQI
jgi:hypothetical protein